MKRNHAGSIIARLKAMINTNAIVGQSSTAASRTIQTRGRILALAFVCALALSSRRPSRRPLGWSQGPGRHRAG